MEEDKEVGTKRKEIVQIVVLTRRSRRILVAYSLLACKYSKEFNHDIENVGHEQSCQFPSSGDRQRLLGFVKRRVDAFLMEVMSNRANWKFQVSEVQ